MTREEQIQAELSRILDILKQDPTVRRVIHFGSSCDPQNIRPWSDIDLCVIQDTHLRFLDRTGYWLKQVRPKIGLDLVVYTPAEFVEMQRSQGLFLKEIEKQGRQLYAA